MSRNKTISLRLALIGNAPHHAVRPKKRKSSVSQNACLASTRAARQERSSRLIALLKSFQEDDAEQQRQGLEELKRGMEAARPGQRRLFGEGFNP